MRESKIQYNPALSVKENAKKNGVSEAGIRYYIKTNLIDRNFDRKQNIIQECRKYLKEYPKATRTELQKKTGHSLSTIRKFWEYISTEKELIDFDSNKAKLRQQKEEIELNRQFSLLRRIPISVINRYLANYTIEQKKLKEVATIKQKIDFYFGQEHENTRTLTANPSFYPTPHKKDLLNFDINHYDASKYVCVAFRSKEDKWKDMWVPFGNMNNGFPFKIGEIKYPNSEQAYICGVFSNDTQEHRALQEACLKARSGYEAKRMIRLRHKEQERKDWHEFKIDWMLFCVWQKIKQNKEFRELLMAIPKGATIIEDNSFKTGNVDKFWGCVNPDRKDFGKLAKKYAKSLNLKSKKATQDSENALLWDFCNYGVFEGTNEMGKILTYLIDCLHKNKEPEIDYDLLNRKKIYLFGKLLFPKEEKSIHLLPNALLGCACGDVIGSRFEFHNTTETDFELFNWRSRYTDDTCLTVCMCEWLLQDPAHTKETLAEKLVFYAKHYKQKCYGHKFKEWVNNPNRQIGQVSSSNGCAMRVSPIGWYAKSIEEAEALAEISASITHNHPDAIKGTKAIVDAIFLLLEENTKEEIKDFISGVFGYNLEISCDELRENTEWTSECKVCVPKAIRAFLESWDFESAIRLAVSLGGDSDTIAAMTGSLAEAYYGVPTEIRQVVAAKLEKEPKFVKIINEFSTKYLPEKIK